MGRSACLNGSGEDEQHREDADYVQADRGSPDIQPRCPRLVEIRRLTTPMIPRNPIHVVNPTATAAETAILRCARDGSCSR
jgi:hypothetical protein